MKMNTFLAVFVVLVAGIALCDGQCFVGYATPVPPGATAPPGCYWNGIFISYMAEFTANCTTCYCNQGAALSCCVNSMHVTHVPDDCKIVPAKDGCGTTAVKKDNENEECDHGVAAVSRRDLQ